MSNDINNFPTLKEVNGDTAPWLRKGVDYFENSIYTYDRYHLKKWKKWINEALSKRSKQERKKAYLATDANEPNALVVAIAEAELTEKTIQSIGAIQGHIPALVSVDQKKPYIKVLRGLA